MGSYTNDCYWSVSEDSFDTYFLHFQFKSYGLNQNLVIDKLSMMFIQAAPYSGAVLYAGKSPPTMYVAWPQIASLPTLPAYRLTITSIMINLATLTITCSSTTI